MPQFYCCAIALLQPNTWSSRTLTLQMTIAWLKYSQFGNICLCRSTHSENFSFLPQTSDLVPSWLSCVPRSSMGFFFPGITPMRVHVEFDIYRQRPGELQRGCIADCSGSRVAPKAFKWWFEISLKGPLRMLLTSPSVSVGLCLSQHVVWPLRFN